MKSLSVLAALAMSGFAQGAAVIPRETWPAATGRNQRRRRYFDYTPRGLPGAKLARQAAKGRLGMATLR